LVVMMARSLLVAVILDCKAFHVLKGDFSLIVTIEDALVGSNISCGGMELLVHGPIEVHQHLASSDRLQDTVLVVVVHLEQLSNSRGEYLVS